MKQQFVRFYLLLLLSCAGLLWALASIYQLLQLDPWNYQLDAEPLFELQQQQGQLIRRVAASSLYFPPELTAQLRQQRVVAVDLPDGQSLYYRQNVDPQWLDQLGPLPTQAMTSSSLPYWLYGGLALLFLALLWPVFRDIRRLTWLTQQFSAAPAPIQSQIKAGSSLYPLAQSLEQMASQISQMISINQDMSRTIAHETRTPLARMKFTLSLAAQQLPSHYQLRLLDDIEEIDALVSNYLDFSRLDYFHRHHPLPVQDPAEFIAELSNRFDIYQQTLELSFHSSVSQAQFHYPAMLLAGQNLLANALRYARSNIQVRFSQDGGYYQLTVFDDGPGLQEHPDVLMRLFRRGDNSSGFGLGLYIVSKVADWHQGEVCIQSAPDQGTSVSLRWPVKLALPLYSDHS